MFICKSLGRSSKRKLYEEVMVSTALYVAETWILGITERKRLSVVDLRCLRNLCKVTRKDRVSNEEVRRRPGVVRVLAERGEQGVLRWLRHVEKMEEGIW